MAELEFKFKDLKGCFSQMAELMKQYQAGGMDKNEAAKEVAKAARNIEDCKLENLPPPGATPKQGEPINIYLGDSRSV